MFKKHDSVRLHLSNKEKDRINSFAEYFALPFESAIHVLLEANLRTWFSFQDKLSAESLEVDPAKTEGFNAAAFAASLNKKRK